MPIFIALRDYADSSCASIFQYIEQYWQNNPNAETIMNHGLGLLLLDGLDEVQERDFTRVRQGIEHFTLRFPLCAVALTCRIAAREYIFENFAEVEMADFDEEQIIAFSSRWFSAHGEPKKAETFAQKLKANKPIRDLATNPLLLTLLCLVFQDRNDFDGTRADLYKHGLDIMLYRWDARRHIERDYPAGVGKASLEPLLAEIAYNRFINGEYFFEQSSLEEQIADFFGKRNVSPEPVTATTSQILNAIEAHIGLLVARAMNVYSFSHLTFQEYLTAQQAVRKPSLLALSAPVQKSPYSRLKIPHPLMRV